MGKKESIMASILRGISDGLSQKQPEPQPKEKEDDFGWKQKEEKMKVERKLREMHKAVSELEKKANEQWIQAGKYMEQGDTRQSRTMLLYHTKTKGYIAKRNEYIAFFEDQMLQMEMGADIQGISEAMNTFADESGIASSVSGQKIWESVRKNSAITEKMNAINAILDDEIREGMNSLGSFDSTLIENEAVLEAEKRLAAEIGAKTGHPVPNLNVRAEQAPAPAAAQANAGKPAAAATVSPNVADESVDAEVNTLLAKAQEMLDSLN